MNFTLEKSIKDNRRMIASGDDSELLKTTRKTGWLITLIGVGICAMLLIASVISITHYINLMNAVAVVVFALFFAMTVYWISSKGVKRIIDPKSTHEPAIAADNRNVHRIHNHILWHTQRYLFDNSM